MKTIDLEIDPDIVIDCEDMPDYIEVTLKGMITRSAKKNDCHWTDIKWDVSFIEGKPVIKVGKK